MDMFHGLPKYDSSNPRIVSMKGPLLLTLVRYSKGAAPARLVATPRHVLPTITIHSYTTNWKHNISGSFPRLQAKIMAEFRNEESPSQLRGRRLHPHSETIAQADMSGFLGQDLFDDASGRRNVTMITRWTASAAFRGCRPARMQTLEGHFGSGGPRAIVPKLPSSLVG